MKPEQFLSPAWLSPLRERTAAEHAMDLVERGDPTLPMQIVDAAEQWARQHLDQAWAEVYEGPCEMPTAYPDNQFGYRVCIRMPAYAQGTWIDVLLDANGVIVGAHHVPIDVLAIDDASEA